MCSYGGITCLKLKKLSNCKLKLMMLLKEKHSNACNKLGFDCDIHIHMAWTNMCSIYMKTSRLHLTYQYLQIKIKRLVWYVLVFYCSKRSMFTRIFAQSGSPSTAGCHIYIILFYHNIKTHFVLLSNTIKLDINLCQGPCPLLLSAGLLVAFHPVWVQPKTMWTTPSILISVI